MNTEELKKYLRDVYVLEKKKNNLNEAYWLLDQKKNNILNSVTDIPLKNMIEDVNYATHYTLWLFPTGILGIIISELLMFRYSNESQSWTKFLIGLFPGIIIGGFLLILGVTISTTIAKKKNAQANIRIEKESKLIQQQNEKKRKNVQWQVKQIEEKMSIIKNQYLETNNILQSYYDLGIIDNKYRYFDAISKIYEYFESGKCSKLTGHGGAYNLFEEEVVLNGIILRSKEIVHQLENIKQNQRTLYSVLQESNGAMSTSNRNCSE